MLNNRLEDLIVMHRSYKIKNILNAVFTLVFVVLLILSAIFTYKTLLKVTSKKVKTVETNSTKVVKTIKVDTNITKPKPKPKPKKPPLPKIDEEKILKKNTFKALMMVEREKPTYQSSYDLAEYYFKHKDYKKASKWAVIASNREAKHEEAWILYAKSKVKLHHKGIAKKSLKIYLLKYKSQKVLNLLNSL